MTVAEKLLLLLSKKPGSLALQTEQEDWNLDNALSLLYEVFPNFKENIVNKDILDFGCGTGYQAVAMVRNRAKYVLGVDISQKDLQKARDLTMRNGFKGKVEFTDSLKDDFKGKFDVVISQNSMEHFSDPIAVLNEMKSALKKDGLLFIVFGPPWFAPYGSHTQFFAKIPWVNLIFPEDAVMKIRSHYRSDGATRYEEVEGGLNKMTVAKFEQIISQCAMNVRHKRYECVKGINFIGKLPLIRELSINRISCVLSKDI